MAIDSEDKRRSVLGFGLPYMAVAPNPDGTINAADREHIAGFYRGIAAGAPPVAVQVASRGLLMGVYNGDT